MKLHSYYMQRAFDEDNRADIYKFLILEFGLEGRELPSMADAKVVNYKISLSLSSDPLISYEEILLQLPYLSYGCSSSEGFYTEPASPYTLPLITIWLKN